MVAALVAAWLFLSAAACAQREQDFYDFKAVNIRGKLVSLEKYRGSVSVHPPGLGATPAGPDGGAPWPWTLLGVAPRGLLPPGNTALSPRPHPGILLGARGTARSCSGSVLRLRGTVLVRGETRKPRSRGRFPTRRFRAAGPDLSQRLDAEGPAFVRHGWKK